MPKAPTEDKGLNSGERAELLALRNQAKRDSKIDQLIREKVQNGLTVEQARSVAESQCDWDDKCAAEAKAAKSKKANPQPDEPEADEVSSETSAVDATKPN